MEKNDKKLKLMTEKRIHRLRANAFYEATKQTVSNSIFFFGFDLQQIQPLPKTPIQEAYYMRQINYYIFVA